MTLLTLVRHGETDWNHQRRIQGSTDIPLNDTGRTQAADAAEALRADLSPAAPTVIVASDLSRARETAQIIADALGLPSPLVYYPQLRERAYGEAEGLTIDEYRERFGGWDRDNVRGAESSEALRRRALSAVRHVVRDVRRTTAPAATSIIAVSHGALIAELIRYASGDDLPRAGERLANGSAHRFLVERDRLRVLSYAGVAA